MLRDATTYAWQAERVNLLVPSADQGAAWCALVHWNKPHVPVSLPTLTHPTATATARVERGMWIVDCPCGGAQMACRTDRRLFCPDCLNAWVQGAWVTVLWPADNDLAVIEALLEMRPTEGTRNWSEPESLQALAAENAEHLWPVT